MFEKHYNSFIQNLYNMIIYLSLHFLFFCSTKTPYSADPSIIAYAVIAAAIKFPPDSAVTLFQEKYVFNSQGKSISN